LMNKDDALVLDIRPAAEFKKGHILGAKQLKPEQINKAEFTSLEKHKDKPIIVVCAMGMTAKRTATNLAKAGFSQVSILKGGMNVWQGASLPVAK
jgi:rhodanese-related sulfurtransferase